MRLLMQVTSFFSIEIASVAEPAATVVVVRLVSDGPLTPGLKLDCGDSFEREGLADALRAAAKRAKTPDLAATVEEDRKRQKEARRKERSMRERLETSETRRKTNAEMRSALRDKYALGSSKGAPG